MSRHALIHPHFPYASRDLGAKYAFLRFFSLGGEVGLAFWNSDTRAKVRAVPAARRRVIAL
jgi:hypothetical protein